MSRDIYAALSGATSAMTQLEAVANNLANASTRGFREARVTFRLEGSGGLGDAYAAPSGMAFSTADGALETDGVSTHVAIRGDGFFALADGSFTRDGAFRVSEDGELVTEDGTGVLGDGGAPVQLQPDEQVTIGSDGTVIGSASGDVGRLGVVRLTGASPLGGNRWTGTGEPLDEVRVVSGALEASNVDAMRGMVELLEASRFFEAQQKAMQTSDEMRQRINRIGGS